MQHVADDLLGVLQGLLPGHLDGGGRHRLGPHALWGSRQPFCPQDRQAGAGLRGAGAVLGDALVDGFIRLVDPIDGQSAARGHERAKHRIIKVGKDLRSSDPTINPSLQWGLREFPRTLLPESMLKR